VRCRTFDRNRVPRTQLRLKNDQPRTLHIAPDAQEGVARGILGPAPRGPNEHSATRSRTPKSPMTSSPGATVGFHNEPDGAQAPDFMRVRRLRFETTITTTRLASDFFIARSDLVRELEAWSAVLSSWICVFTRQDFVEIGKTRGGIRGAPIVTWSGDQDGYRVNASPSDSISAVSRRLMSCRVRLRVRRLGSRLPVNAARSAYRTHSPS
jgi:hypothetical protein